MNSDKRCANCDWWEFEDAEGVQGARRAKCLRVLPQADGQGWAVWPLTLESHRCWQWAAVSGHVSERLQTSSKETDKL